MNFSSRLKPRHRGSFAASRGAAAAWAVFEERRLEGPASVSAVAAAGGFEKFASVHGSYSVSSSSEKASAPSLAWQT